MKYEKDYKLARQILHLCSEISDLNVNLIDSLKASPLHIAMRKRQFQAISDCIGLNIIKNQKYFDFNIPNKKG